ncbi:ABC transporter ATP-binding protein [Desulfocucumis palustris]|uniref:ABC transporter ATP-binding protein n=1 Tax=Desulfocucumis palustris TaxID=1898651 RepID=A0A2L2XB23_9FIRM|nr:ATP-binding cassette domain-containing protein [Desulfocucumis palustris]GBF33388.1 ABC transporter ATP-binding protein [Desulfocucumis palustris]
MNEVKTVLVNNLTKGFDNIMAVSGINFEVYCGECFGLIGPNGAGKSTTIKMLTTLLPPDDGEAVINGYSIVKNPAGVRGSIGYVPQLLSVDGAMTGYENLLVFSKLYGLKRKQREERIKRVLDITGLEDAAHRQVKTYSGGMVRRLEIGQAILNYPQVLFLDEPTVGLDPVARKTIWKHIEKLRCEQNMTILLTTHYMEEAEALCSRIAIMNKGKIAVMGTARELRESTGNPHAGMDDVFAYYAGALESQEGDLRDASRTRRTAKRLG